MLIRTPRLVLRPFGPGDITDLHSLLSRPDVTRYLYTELSPDLEATAATLARWSAQTTAGEEGQQLCLAVVMADPASTDGKGPVIGEVMLNHASATHRQGEIGYLLHPDHHGRGLATEAAAALLRVGFEQLGFHRIVGQCDARNTASARVMERLGMTCEGHFVENEWIKGEWTDELVYAIRASTWASTRPPVQAATSERRGGT